MTAQELGAPRARPSLMLMTLLPAVVAAVVYANTLGNGFVADDAVMARQLSQGAGPHGIQMLGARYGLSMATYALDKWLWGQWAPGFHLTSLVLNALASALAAYGAFVLTRSRLVGILCGFFFAVHPVHTEAVASFVNRKDILAMIFVLLALLFWLKTRMRWLFYLASLVCYGLALSSKEVAAAGLVVMLLLADLLPGFGHHSEWRSRLRVGFLRVLPPLLIGAIATIVYAEGVFKYFRPEWVERSTEYLLLSYGPVLPTVFANVPDIVRLLLLPITLSADHLPNLQSSIADPRAIVGMILLASWIAGAVALARRAPVAGFALAWALVMYLPSSNIVPLTQFFVAERYLYVPSFGVSMLLALGAERVNSIAIMKNLRFLRIGLICLVILIITAGASRSVLRNRDWRDEYTLWSSAIEAGCGTWRAHCYLGILIMNQGDYEGAVRELAMSVKAHPRCPKPRYWLGQALEKQGRLENALAEYSKLVELFPQHVDGRHAMAHVLQLLGRYAEAIQAYQETLKITRHVRSLSDLSWLLATCPDKKLRDGREAVRLAQLANIATDYADPRHLTVLAAAWLEAGQRKKAAKVGRDAAELARSHGDYALARRIQTTLDGLRAAWSPRKRKQE